MDKLVIQADFERVFGRQLGIELIDRLFGDVLYEIQVFGELVKDWNRFSLVANSTLMDLWGWHFYEALSILHLLSENVGFKIYDFGAGGGVIGYPLFLAGIDVTLVERSSNKLFFLKKIVQYENVVECVQDYSDSLVIVRGVTLLIGLLDVLNNVSRMILFKSLSVKREISDALRVWDFQFELFARVGNAKGFILYIWDIKKKF